MCHLDECCAMTISRTTLSLNQHGFINFSGKYYYVRLGALVYTLLC
jgi:hypothetical protein